MESWKEELYHHGILGQKWGIRRFQNSDGTLTPLGKQRLLSNASKIQNGETLGKNSVKAVKIKAGSKMYRTTTGDETLDGSKYVTYFDTDRAFYRSEGANWIAWVQNKRLTDLKETTFVLKEDLKIPTRKEVLDVYTKEFLNDEKLIKEAAVASTKMLFTNNYGGQDANNIHNFYKKVESSTMSADKKKEIYDKVPVVAEYKDRIESTLRLIKSSDPDKSLLMYSEGYGNDPKLRQKMIDSLKKRGYNAMTDEAGVGGHGYGRETRQALIVFDGRKVFDASKTMTKPLYHAKDKIAAAQFLKNSQYYYRTMNSTKLRSITSLSEAGKLKTLDDGRVWIDPSYPVDKLRRLFE